MIFDSSLSVNSGAPFVLIGVALIFIGVVWLYIEGNNARQSPQTKPRQTDRIIYATLVSVAGIIFLLIAGITFSI